jgi:hypothetical protein
MDLVRTVIMSPLAEIRVRLFALRSVILRLVGAVGAGGVLCGEFGLCTSLGFKRSLRLGQNGDEECDTYREVARLTGGEFFTVIAGAEEDGLHVGRITWLARRRSAALPLRAACSAVRLAPSPRCSPPMGEREESADTALSEVLLMLA